MTDELVEQASDLCYAIFLAYAYVDSLAVGQLSLEGQQGMNEKQLTKYLADGGLKCPFCGSLDLSEGDDFRRAGADILVEVACGGCGVAWSDVYSLTGVEAI